jgi:hypothetical protein
MATAPSEGVTVPKTALGVGCFSDVAFAGDGDHGILIAGFSNGAATEIRMYAWAGVVLPDDKSVPFFSETMVQGFGYGRVHCDPSTGIFYAGWHDGAKGYILNLATKQRWTFGDCEGNFPITFGGSYAAIQGRSAEGYPVRLMILASGALTGVVRMGKPTGLARVEGTDAAPRIIDNDENRFLFAGGTQPDFAGDLAVAEGPDNGCKWRLTDGHVGILWPGELAYVPKCASGIRFAISTWGAPGGIRLFVGDRVELIGAVIPGDPGLEARIKALENKVADLQASDAKQNNDLNGLHGTVNNHETRIAALESDNGGGGGGDPEPGAVPLPDKVKANVNALYLRHKDLAEGDDDQRRQLMTLITEQNAFDLGPSHGWKSADPSRPPSKDAIAYAVHGDDSGAVWIADVFDGATRAPSFPNGYTKTEPRQHFIKMNPVNHLG